MIIKKQIAANIVAQYHSEEAAVNAALHFERTVQKRNPQESDYVPLSLVKLRDSFPTGSLSLLDLCDFAGIGMSRSEIRRLIRGGGVRVDGKKILDEHTNIQIAAARTLWIGKRDKFSLVDNIG